MTGLSRIFFYKVCDFQIFNEARLKMNDNAEGELTFQMTNMTTKKGQK